MYCQTVGGSCLCCCSHGVQTAVGCIGEEAVLVTFYTLLKSLLKMLCWFAKGSGKTALQKVTKILTNSVPRHYNN